MHHPEYHQRLACWLVIMLIAGDLRLYDMSAAGLLYSSCPCYTTVFCTPPYLSTVFAICFCVKEGDAENAGVEFAALNGYGKPLQNLKSTQRRYKTQHGDRLHCSAFGVENVKAAEQFTVAQRKVE